MDSGLRAKVDDGSDRMQNKIRMAQKMKVPYMLVVGAKEAETQSVSVRLRSGEDLKSKTVDEFIALAKAELEK